VDINSFLKINENILDPFVEDMSQELWDKNLKLKSSVRIHIIKKLETWLKGYTDKKPQRILLMGSMTGFQYTETSDIDINFVINEHDDEKLEAMRKSLPNNHTLPGSNHPINYFVRNDIAEEWKNSGPIYDVIKDKWVKKPSKENQVKETTIIGSYRVVIELARVFLAGLDSIMTEFHADVAAYKAYESYLPTLKKPEDIDVVRELIKFKINEIVSDIDGVRLGKHLLHSLRQEAFVEDKSFKISTQIIITDSANASINNMIYKFVEKLGYFEKLQKIMDEKEKYLALLNQK